MAIDERTRHRMYLRLQEVLGDEVATALMEHLPPVGWSDVATKHDIAQLEARIDLKLESTKNELKASFREEFARQSRTMVSAYVGSLVSLLGVVLAARLV